MNVGWLLWFAVDKCVLNPGLQWDQWVLNELIHSRQWFNRHLFHAGRQSVVWRTLWLGWLRMTAPVGYRHVMSLYVRHRQYECQRGIGSLAQGVLSLKRLSAGPGFNPQTRQNKLFQDYWRACFEINFSDRQEGLSRLTVSSINCDR